MREYTITFQEGFGKGLRAKKHTQKNMQALVQSRGAVPEDGILRSLESIQEFGSSLGASRPFPQAFKLKNLILVTLQTAFYQYEDEVFTELISGLTSGSTWSVADYWPYVVATNGEVIVTRNPQSATWEVVSESGIPNCRCLADINGQLFAGGVK